MAKNSTRQLTEFEQIDQRFAAGHLTAVVDYINRLALPVSITNSDNGYDTPKPKSEQTALYQNSDVYLDSGDGRVSTGLRGLELLSRLCKGVAPDSLFLFNNVIYYSNVNDIKAATPDRLIEIISVNLGLNFVSANALPIAPSEVANFNVLCTEIGQQVKSGVFRKENYKSRVLVMAKKLALAAARNPTGKL